MFGWIQLAAAAAIAAAAAFSSWWVTSNAYEAKEAVAAKASQAALDAANLKADNAAIDWQAWAESQPAKIIYRNRKAADVLKANPVWATAPIPDGVRQLLEQPSADTGARRADGSVPAASAASAAAQSGSGAGVPRAPGFFRRMLETPRSTGEGREP